jgi:hypothetical protein
VANSEALERLGRLRDENAGQTWTRTGVG